jgi:deazaflavin-dependent oxidoreductase (nitroreductase family)
MDMPDDMRAFNRQVIEEFRANDGMLGPPFAGDSTLLLTTKGARTGRSHTVPIMFKEDGNRLLVIASASGAPRHPDWYRNLVAHPAVIVERGADRCDMVARTAEGEERDRLWRELLETHPFFADHQAQVTRLIPLVLLERPGEVSPRE